MELINQDEQKRLTIKALIRRTPQKDHFYRPTKFSQKKI